MIFPAAVVEPGHMLLQKNVFLAGMFSNNIFRWREFNSPIFLPYLFADKTLSASLVLPPFSS